jgi:hypothetical protein
VKDVKFDKHRMQRLTTFAFLAAIAGCPTCFSLGLIPDVAAPQAEDSVPMGDLRLFPELKLVDIPVSPAPSSRHGNLSRKIIPVDRRGFARPSSVSGFTSARNPPARGEQVNGMLKMLPGGKLERHHANFKFSPQDFRFTVGNNDAIYAFCMTVPSPGTQLKIKSLGMDEKYSDKPVKHVSLLGYDGELK